MKQDDKAPLAHRVPEACSRLGIGRSTLYRLIGEGAIRPIRIGHRVLVPESELQRYIASLLEQAA